MNREILSLRKHDVGNWWWWLQFKSSLSVSHGICELNHLQGRPLCDHTVSYGCMEMRGRYHDSYAKMKAARRQEVSWQRWSLRRHQNTKRWNSWTLSYLHLYNLVIFLAVLPLRRDLWNCESIQLPAVRVSEREMCKIKFNAAWLVVFNHFGESDSKSRTPDAIVWLPCTSHQGIALVLHIY